MANLHCLDSQDLDEEFVFAPVTNRGALNAQNKVRNVDKSLIITGQNGCSTEMGQIKLTMADIEIVIDWFEFTILGKTIDQVLLDFELDIRDDVQLFDTRIDKYDNMFVYKEKIKFLYSSRDRFVEEDKRMGIHVIFSGYACREFEIEYSWKWLIRYCVLNDCNISRVDIAYDSFTDKYFTIDRVRRALRNGCCVTKAKTALNYEKYEIDSGTICGETVKFGSSSSETCVVFYNKLQERMNDANYIIDPKIKVWYRCELRVRRDSAYNMISLFDQYPDNIPVLSLEILNNYISIKREKRYQTNEQRTRWTDVKWWSNFLKTTQKLQLSNKAIQTTIQRKKGWLELSVAKSLGVVLVASVDNLFGDELIRFVQNGLKKIKKLDLAMINTYRLERGASVLTKESFDKLVNRINGELERNYDV